MSEIATLARPYAQAIFEVSKAQNVLPQTSMQLQLASAAVNDEGFASLIGHPKVPADKLADAVIGILGDNGDVSCGNFIKVLADNGRLPLLPEIAAQFEHLRATAENRLDVQVTTAQALDDTQQQQLRDSLTQRFGRDIELQITIDDELIAGAVVRAGDQVIDGSARGRLQRLQQQLAH